MNKTDGFSQRVLFSMKIKKYISKKIRPTASCIESKSKLYTANGTRHE